MQKANVNGEVVVSELRQIFDTMSYAEIPAKLNAALKKIAFSDGVVYTSIQSGAPFTGGVHKESYEIAGIKVQENVIEMEELIPALTHRFPFSKKETFESRATRLAKFQELVRAVKDDLVVLEAYAGQVPGWTVEKHDVPTWIPSTNDDATAEIRGAMAKKNSFVVVRVPLDTKTYSLASMLTTLSAIIQKDEPAILITHAKDDASWRCIFPLLYLAHLINKSDIHRHNVAVYNVTNLHATEAIWVAQGEDFICLDMIQRDFEEEENAGKNVHIVVDAGADVPTAVASIKSKIWTPGMQINHRCRPLLFVHSAAHGELLAQFTSSLEGITISQAAGETANLDFLLKPSEHMRQTVESVKKMGAVVIGKTPDLTGPSVIKMIGTSSDLVAMREAGLGHVLVVIGYRNASELLQLANNFGEPEQVFIYSNFVSVTVPLLKQLNGKQLVVNDAQYTSDYLPMRPPCLFLCKYKSDNDEGELITSTPMNVAACKTWQSLSTSAKMDKLQNWLCVGGDPLLLPQLWAHQLDMQSSCTMVVPKSPGSTTVIVASDKNLRIIIDAIFIGLMRGGCVNILLVDDVELPEGLCNTLKSKFPMGLVDTTRVTAHKVRQLRSVSPLVWIVQRDGGEKHIICAKCIPLADPNTLVITSYDKDEDQVVLNNAKRALSQVYKLCYL